VNSKPHFQPTIQSSPLNASTPPAHFQQPWLHKTLPPASIPNPSRPSPQLCSLPNPRAVAAQILSDPRRNLSQPASLRLSQPPLLAEDPKTQVARPSSAPPSTTAGSQKVAKQAPTLPPASKSAIRHQPARPLCRWSVATKRPRAEHPSTATTRLLEAFGWNRWFCWSLLPVVAFDFLFRLVMCKYWSLHACVCVHVRRYQYSVVQD
jgi:hypothetical protein